MGRGSRTITADANSRRCERRHEAATLNVERQGVEDLPRRIATGLTKL